MAKQMTEAERKVWSNTHKDYRSVVDGERYVMRFVDGKGSCLVPLSEVAHPVGLD